MGCVLLGVRRHVDGPGAGGLGGADRAPRAAHARRARLADLREAGGGRRAWGGGLTWWGGCAAAAAASQQAYPQHRGIGAPQTQRATQAPIGRAHAAGPAGRSVFAPVCPTTRPVPHCQLATHHAVAELVHQRGQHLGVARPGGARDLPRGRAPGRRAGGRTGDEGRPWRAAGCWAGPAGCRWPRRQGGRERSSGCTQRRRRMARNLAAKLTRLPSTTTSAGPTSRNEPPAARTSGPHAGYAVQARPAQPPAAGARRGRGGGAGAARRSAGQPREAHGRRGRRCLRRPRPAGAHTAGGAPAAPGHAPAAASSCAPWQTAAMGFLAPTKCCRVVGSSGWERASEREDCAWRAGSGRSGPPERAARAASPTRPHPPWSGPPPAGPSAGTRAPARCGGGEQAVTTNRVGCQPPAHARRPPPRWPPGVQQPKQAPAAGPRKLGDTGAAGQRGGRAALPQRGSGAAHRAASNVTIC